MNNGSMSSDSDEGRKLQTLGWLMGVASSVVNTPEGRRFYITITPEIAKTMLGHVAPRQRSVKPSQVRRIVDDLTNGRWRRNGDCIRYNLDLWLWDGQHRCHAVVDSGVTLAEYPVLVCTEAQAEMTFDTGLVVRSAADMTTASGDGRRASWTGLHARAGPPLDQALQLLAHGARALAQAAPEVRARIRAPEGEVPSTRPWFFKVGFSGDVQARVSALQVGSPLPLQLFLDFPGGAAEERFLHDTFAEERHRGEWFRMSAHAHSVLTALCAVNGAAIHAEMPSLDAIAAEGGVW